MRDAMNGSGQRRRKRPAREAATGDGGAARRRRAANEDDEVDGLPATEDDETESTDSSKAPRDPFLAALTGLSSNMATMASARLMEANMKKEQGSKSAEAELINAQARLKEAEANAAAQKAAADTSKGMLAVLTALAAKLG